MAELLRRSLRNVLPVDEDRPWMHYAGVIESGDAASSQKVDELVYGRKDRRLRRQVGAHRLHSHQQLTLADAVGLHIMRDGRVVSCWSTDRHLGLTGTPLVIHLA